MPRLKHFPRYSLKIFDGNGKLIKRASTKKKRKISFFLSGIQPRNATLYRVAVSYGEGEDVWGDRVVFDNCGDYATKHEALSAFRDFSDQELIDHIRGGLS